MYNKIPAEAAKRALAVALRALDRGQVPGWRANLAHHVAQKTPIMCGEQASLWTDGKGGG